MDRVNKATDYYLKKLAGRRKGIKNLCKYLAEIGFFTAPCSGGNHLCCDGGLVVHSANVIDYAERIGNKVLDRYDYMHMHDSIILCAALHDIGKCGQFDKPYYVPNMVKDGRPTKAEPEQKYKRSESKPFEVNKDLLHVDHAMRSLLIANMFIDLTEEEQFAILYHDGMYGSMKYEYAGHETKLSQIIHMADFWVCHFVEGKNVDDVY